MKTRFTSADVVAAVGELQRLVGMRVVQVYDVDSKTYLFKLGRQEEKAVLLFESGVRIHTTEYDWPKSTAPSGFSMKLRKHLKNKRVESITQLGVDRIVDIQFGINDAAYHVIVELYDRGNVVLTDGAYLILNILRPRQAGAEDVRFAVRETYPVSAPSQSLPQVTEADVRTWLESAAEGEPLKKILLPKVFCGPAVLDHCLQMRNITVNVKIRRESITDEFVAQICAAVVEAHKLTESFKVPGTCCGLITLKVEKRVQPSDDGSTEIVSYNDFHPYLFKGLETQRLERFDSYLQAVDAFFSRQEEQKISMKAHNLEKEAVRKLENIKIDHEKRVYALETAQMTDIEKANLIQNNLDLVEKALFAVRSAIASQMSWDDIGNIIKEAQLQGDPVASCIRELHLDRNHFSMYLSDPFDDSEDARPAVVDIDIEMSAYANATRYFDKKKQAAKKQQKTLESSAKALKSAQKKTKEVLKQVELTTNIARTRKTYWFEKFYWFVSSENYLVIGGRDAAQNDMIVKKYLTKGDVYVHADLHGASSVIIKNPSGEPIPPKTLNEAGTMAISYSAAWEAKVVTTAWWVYHHQVSKTAPTGEYLSQGSFMVRGKKNYLPPLFLTMGFGFVFRLDEESIARHADDRKVRLAEDARPQEEMQAEEEEEASNQNQDEISVSSSEDEPAFPDTQVNVLQPIAGGILHGMQEVPENEEIIVYSQAVKKKVVVKASNKKDKSQQAKREKQQATVEPTESQQAAQKKKLSKAKLRKIKQKYGDQDEEERQLKMRLLASAGKHGPVQPGGGTKAGPAGGQRVADVADAKGKEGSDLKPFHTKDPDTTKVEAQPAKGGSPAAGEGQDEDGKETKRENDEVAEDAENEVVDEDSEDDGGPGEDGPSADDLTNLLNSLTGIPQEEDVLLYAVPICAPYQTMTNYKFKVKLTPGTGKRGKAAKTALNMFQHDKAASQREKDLLKAVKDQDIARNMPGKVKMSAANLQKFRK